MNSGVFGMCNNWLIPIDVNSILQANNTLLVWKLFCVCVCVCVTFAFILTTKVFAR